VISCRYSAGLLVGECGCVACVPVLCMCLCVFLYILTRIDIVNLHSLGARAVFIHIAVETAEVPWGQSNDQ
jgi:hypothetical protein